MKVKDIKVGGAYEAKNWGGLKKVTVVSVDRVDHTTGFGYMAKTTKVWQIVALNEYGSKEFYTPQQVVREWDSSIDEAKAARARADRAQSEVVDRINAVTDYTIQASVPFDRHTHARGYGVDVHLSPAKAARLAELLEQTPDLLG